MEGQEQKYFLALQRMPGDYKFIDISKLNIANGYNPMNLAEIDSFTMYFSIDEIMKSIKEANIVEEAYQVGTLVIQDNQKHKPLRVLDKNYVQDFNLAEFLKDKISNKSIMNNIAYKLDTILEDKSLVEAFKIGIKSNNLELLLNTIYSINYIIQRKFIIYLIEQAKKDKEKKPIQGLIRDKAA